MRRFRIILLAGATFVAICGCNNVKFAEVETTAEVVTEAPTEASTEAPTETESVASCNTEVMDMLLKKQEGELSSKYLDKLQIDDEVIFAVPKSGTESSSKNMLEVKKEGVSIKFEINPEIRSGKSDSPIYECLRTYIEEYYEGDSNYDAVEIDSIEDLSEYSARNVVTYVDTSSSETKVCESTWYLFDLHDEKSLMMCVNVCHSDTDTTSKDIIKALEAYYEIEVQYDATVEKQKLSETSNTFTYNGMSFELPADWEEDNTLSENGMAVYAPGGSFINARYSIIIMQESGSYPADFGWNPSQKEEFRRYLESSTGYSIPSIDVKEIGSTKIGNTVNITCYVNYEGINWKFDIYCGMTTSKMTMVYGFGSQSGVDSIKDVLEGIIN